MACWSPRRAARYASGRGRRATGGDRLAKVGWSYSDPTPGFRILTDDVAFYPAPFDRITVDGEVVTPQPGEFYGGWITSRVVGPFKGVPGSRFW